MAPKKRIKNNNPTGRGGFKKGESGNPGGRDRKKIERAMTVAEKLDIAFSRPDGTDEYVDILVQGCRDYDSTCLKLAANYRYGKPVERHEIKKVDAWDDDTLKRELWKVTKQWEREGLVDGDLQ